MSYLEIVLGLVVAILGFWVWKLKEEKKQSEGEVRVLEKEKNEFEHLASQAASAEALASQGGGIAGYLQKMQEKKEQAKVKIMEMLGKKKKVSNREVAKVLDVSSATVRRYFDELEAENKAKQVGKVGQSVYYSLK